MTPELDRMLCENYPEIFRDRHAPMSQTAMCWGFDCDDGWYNIINTLCYQIQHYINQRNYGQNSVLVPQVVAEQVKEKYGTLRFYAMGGDDYTDGLITMAEAMSAKTCETCGSPGKLRGYTWYYTSCNEHADEEHRDEAETTFTA